ncbi:hypothetical protein, partial [Agathobaculum sp.]|uniref:hypothetical protein n=1 Tax=Agathobaculum sp. TaxID=2048138 RepID=UPI003AEF9528
MKKRLRSKCTKTGGVYLGFRTLRGRKFPHRNFRTSVFCKVKTQIVGKTKFFDSLKGPPQACLKCLYSADTRDADGRGADFLFAFTNAL